MRAKCAHKHVSATAEQLQRTERVFTKMLRSDARIEQKGRCTYCKDPMDLVTAEHLLPRSRGGSTVRANIRAACEPCNSAKGNGTEAYFRRVLHQHEIPLGDTGLTLAWIRFRLNRRVEKAEKRIAKLVGMV